MQIKKERKQTYRYSYTQLVAIKPAKAPGQDSIGTGGQNSIGANIPGYSEVIKSIGCLTATACDWPLMGRNWLSGIGPRRLLVSLLGSA